MQRQLIKVSQLKNNTGQVEGLPKNPRLIRDEKFAKLKKSLEDDPEMMQLREVIAYDNNGELVVICGNMRLRALKDLGVKEVPVKVLPTDTPVEKLKAYTIKDNVPFGEHDWSDLANEWDAEQLSDWGVDVPVFDDVDKKDSKENEARQKLQDKFIVPPFSILDTRQGYWQERKRYWKELIGDAGESRIEKLGSGGLTIDDDSSSWLHNPKLGNGVSILDPVLAELSIKWFGLEKCKTFDCFAGDSVFGYVSSYMGNTFTGIELRQEQADLNNERVNKFDAKYICDDGRNVLKYIDENSQDLLFSCPPYFDLEVYSDLPNDASNQKEYRDFLKILDNAFTDAVKCLKDNRFAVITVGDVRDKKGIYYGFVDDVKSIFKKAGTHLYNELILIEPIAFGAIRAAGNMKNRKVTKCHQNVLVFYKGDPKQVKAIFPEIEVNDYESTDV